MLAKVPRQGTLLSLVAARLQNIQHVRETVCYFGHSGNGISSLTKAGIVDDGSSLSRQACFEERAGNQALVADLAGLVLSCAFLRGMQ